MLEKPLVKFIDERCRLLLGAVDECRPLRAAAEKDKPFRSAAEGGRLFLGASEERVQVTPRGS